MRSNYSGGCPRPQTAQWGKVGQQVEDTAASARNNYAETCELTWKHAEARVVKQRAKYKNNTPESSRDHQPGVSVSLIGQNTRTEKRL